MVFLFNRILDDLYIIISRKKIDEIGRCWYFLRKEKERNDMYDIIVFVEGRGGGGDNN